MEKMTTERRNEIAYLYVVERILRRHGIPSWKPNEIKREIGNTAKSLGISFEEASEFARELVWNLVEQAFPDLFVETFVSAFAGQKKPGTKNKKPLLGPAFQQPPTSAKK
ncbi:MAG: hypothetical protein ABIG87_02645 [Patescibacteria group bacterium]